MVRRSELPCVQKCKQVCVSKLLSAKKEKKWEPGSFFFMCLIDMNKFFEKHMTFETCLVFMLYALHAHNYGFTNNKHILHKASLFVHAHVD